MVKRNSVLGPRRLGPRLALGPVRGLGPRLRLRLRPQVGLDLNLGLRLGPWLGDGLRLRLRRLPRFRRFWLHRLG